MHSNKLMTINVQISKRTFSSFKASRVKHKNHTEDKKKRKMTSEKESRKTVINEEKTDTTNSKVPL